MPYPAAREHPASTPCVKKLRGSSVGVSDAAKNSVPRRRPLVENECHCVLSIWPHLSIRVNVSFGGISPGADVCSLRFRRVDRESVTHVEPKADECARWM